MFILDSWVVEMSVFSAIYWIQGREFNRRQTQFFWAAFTYEKFNISSEVCIEPTYN